MWLNEDMFIPTLTTFILCFSGTFIFFLSNIIIRFIFRLPCEISKFSFLFAFMTFVICITVGLVIAFVLVIIGSEFLELNKEISLYLCVFLFGLLLQILWAIQEKRIN